MSILDDLGDVCDVTTAANVLGMAPSTAYAAIREGRFPVRTFQVGSRISVPTAELRRLLNGDPPPDPGVTLRLDRIASLLEELVRLQYQSVSVRGVAS